jgi:hypothetical protein
LSQTQQIEHDEQAWLSSMGGSVLPRRILGGDEDDLSSLGFSLGPEIDDLFRAGSLPDGWKMRPSDQSSWCFIDDEHGIPRVGVFFRTTSEERLAHMMILADAGALA